ncbi:MAG: hypothetical protein V3S97_09210 [Candidatus Bathyarchaeia archaeon]
MDVNTSSSEEAPDQISESQQVAHWGVPVERGRSSRRQNAMAHKSFERSAARFAASASMIVRVVKNLIHFYL